MHASLNELLSVVPSATLTAPASFIGVTTNSKTVEAGNLFVALRGERFDAHDFIVDVAALGAAAVVVERLPDGLPIPALIVPDTRYALGQIAQLWRKRFTVPLIGVTGSNGKTTVKEMIAAILSAAFGTDHFLATRGNLNNEIGVPLTLFNLNAQHRAAVVELGMNHPGEIVRLTEIALPTVGVVNNAQREHQEFMASVAAVAAENGSVISGLSEEGCAVFPADDEFAPLWTSYAGSRRLITFALDKQASVTAQWRATDFGSEIKLNARGEQVSFVLSAAGQHNVRNALAACAATLAVGINLEIIARGLSDFTPVAGRLQKKQATNGAIVIDDTYNANPDSVRAAIDVLANAPAPRTLVLGDMGEVGSEGVAFHEEIGEYARARHIDQLFTVGELARHASRAFGRPARHFETMETLNEEVASVPPGASVLVKGSRFMKMERVVQKLTGAAMGGH
ncbi:MAG: UDP-N-acetylmuramoyl-tripeptide--D-alanyl-D-alanine ligase [Pseudomonadota bacterium]|jgi:UDP-N-acetylmuramoyl-tripeptide--D-alanyl-D-alanine ligase